MLPYGRDWPGVALQHSSWRGSVSWGWGAAPGCRSPARRGRVRAWPGWTCTWWPHCRWSWATAPTGVPSTGSTPPASPPPCTLSASRCHCSLLPFILSITQHRTRYLDWGINFLKILDWNFIIAISGYIKINRYMSEITWNISFCSFMLGWLLSASRIIVSIVLTAFSEWYCPNPIFKYELLSSLCFFSFIFPIEFSSNPLNL